MVDNFSEVHRLPDLVIGQAKTGQRVGQLNANVGFGWACRYRIPVKMDAKVRLVDDVTVHVHGKSPSGLQILLHAATEVESFHEFGLSGSPEIDNLEPSHSISFL
jgi:hypothetical protein